MADSPEQARRWCAKECKRQEMPPHQELEAFIDEHLTAAGICDGGRGSLFHTARGKTGALAGEPMHRIHAYRMIRRRMVEAGFKVKI